MREFLPDYQGATIVTLFILGSGSIYGLGARANNDLWLAFLLAIVLALPMILLYARLRSILPSENLYGGLDRLYGSWIGRLVAFLYSLYAWYLACIVGKDVSIFINSVALSFTPQPVLVLFLALLSLWAAKEGLQTLGRWSALALKSVLTVIAITMMLLVTQVNLKEFLPLLYNGWKPVLLGSLELADFPFLETVVLIWGLEGLSSKKSPYKILLPGFFIGAIVLTVVSSLTMSVIGPDKYASSYFPSYLAVSRISLFRFLTRLEATVGITFVVTCFLKIAVCLVIACKGLAHALGIADYRILVTPLALGIIPGSQWLIKSQMEAYINATKVIGPYDFSMQVILPLMLWITAEFKLSVHRKKGEGAN